MIGGRKLNTIIRTSQIWLIGDVGVPKTGANLNKMPAAYYTDITVIQPIFDFANLITEDQETKEALRLFAEDELSSTKWLVYACNALNAPAAAASATASA